MSPRSPSVVPCPSGSEPLGEERAGAHHRRLDQLLGTRTAATEQVVGAVNTHIESTAFLVAEPHRSRRLG